MTEEELRRILELKERHRAAFFRRRELNFLNEPRDHITFPTEYFDPFDPLAD